MRLSTQQIFLTSLNGILDSQARLHELQQQIATGRRIDTPGDDPVASSKIISLNQKLSLTSQFRENASIAESKLRVEETVLGTAEDVIQRLRQLTIQAGDGALSQEDKQAISVEVKERLEQLVGLANTRDSNDQYIFGGFQSGQEPIVKDTNGGYVYQGDEGQLYIKVAENLDVAASDSGARLFMDVDEPLNFAAATNAANAGTLVVDDQGVVNQNAFDAFHPDGATVTFSVTGGNISYTVTRVSDGAVISGGSPSAPLSNVPYTDGDSIDFEGMQLAFSGIPADGDTIDVVSQAPAKLDIFSALEQFAGILDNAGATSDLGYSEAVADMLISLDNALDNILDTQVAVGGRLNVIDDAVANNDNLDQIGRQVLSDLQDLDYADALSKLSLQQFVLEATQRTFVQVTNLSLFNFLR